MGIKATKATKEEMGKTIFSLYSLGVVTSRDILVYSFELELLQERVRTFIEIYNTTVDRKRRHDPDAPVENFIDTNDPHIKWSRQVKASLKKLELSNYEESHFRTSLYRPFTQKNLYFDNFWNEERYQQYRIFSTPETETENRVICVSGIGSNKPFQTLMARIIPCLDTLEKTQSFPFYTYDERWHKPPRKHHRLGGGTIPRPLSRRHHRKVGHLPLRLRSPPPPRLSGAVSRQTSSATYRACRTPRTFGRLPKRVNGWGKFTFTTKKWTNIHSVPSKPPIPRSTGASKK